MNLFQKVLLITTVWFCMASSLVGQSIQVSVSVPPPHPIYLEDYLEFRAQAVVTVTNTTSQSVQIKLLAYVEGLDSPVYGKIKPSFQPATPILLGPNETRVLTGEQLRSINANLSLNDIEHQGVDPRQMARTGTLPEGSYRLCMTAYHYFTGQQLSPAMAGCAMLRLTHYDPPILVQPQQESKLIVTQPQMVNFVWTPAGIPGKTRYNLRLVDMTAAGLFNPNDAFTGWVIPFFDRQGLVNNTYTYTLSDLPLQAGHLYAVEVVAYDPTNGIAFRNNGRSAVTTFTWTAGGGLFDGPLDITEQPFYQAMAADPSMQIRINNIPKDDVNTDLFLGGFDFSHAYKGDDGGLYYLTVQYHHQKILTFFLYGEHPGKEYGILIKGTLNMWQHKKRITGTFASIPKYAGRESGYVYLDLEENGKKFVIPQDDLFSKLPFTSLEAINLNDYVHLLPPVRDTAYFRNESEKHEDFWFEGLYHGSDGGIYHASEFGNEIYMVGEPAFHPGQKPAFCKVFFGSYSKISDKIIRAQGEFLTMPKGQLTHQKVETVILEFRLIEEQPYLHAYPYPRMASTITQCAKWTKVDPKRNNFSKKSVVLESDGRSKFKAEKSASLVFYYFGDGPLTTFFQNVGVNLQHSLNGYDKTCLLKASYSGINKSPDYHDQPTKENFFKYLKILADEGYYIDIFVFTHGRRRGIETQGKDQRDDPDDVTWTITATDIRSELSAPFYLGQFPIRMVYQMNCHGSKLNEAFRDVGAKAMVGTRSVNFLPTRFNVFGKAWQNGANFTDAVMTSRNDGPANSAGATFINLELKARMKLPLSWKCKSCPPFTNLNDTKNCIGCFFKSFYGIAGERDDTPAEDKPVGEEYNFNMSGTNNLLHFSEPLIIGAQPNLTRSTKPVWY